MPAVRDLDHAPRVCDAALARAFTFLGKRWNGVLLGTLTGGPAGFAELRRAVGGISDSVLSDRLSGLAQAGLIDRAVQTGPPVSVTYRLTDAGQALLPAMHALTRWAADNLPVADGCSTEAPAAADPRVTSGTCAELVAPGRADTAPA